VKIIKQEGDKFKFSTRNCRFVRTFLDLIFKDLYSLNKKNITKGLKTKGYYLITEKDRHKIYGKVRVSPRTLKYSVGHP